MSYDVNVVDAQILLLIIPCKYVLKRITIVVGSMIDNPLNKEVLNMDTFTTKFLKIGLIVASLCSFLTFGNSYAAAGCCSKHGGVSNQNGAPKCDQTSDRLVCNDNTISPSCRCGGGKAAAAAPATRTEETAKPSTNQEMTTKHRGGLFGFRKKAEPIETREEATKPESKTTSRYKAAEKAREAKVEKAREARAEKAKEAKEAKTKAAESKAAKAKEKKAKAKEAKAKEKEMKAKAKEKKAKEKKTKSKEKSKESKSKKTSEYMNNERNS